MRSILQLLQRYDGLGHTLFGLALMAPFALAGALWTGYAVQCAWWISRERRDYEIRLQREAGFDPHAQWYRGWDARKWSRRDLWCPVVANGLIALALAAYTGPRS